ncbi:hypothetical protein DMC30DRAFT_443507 [Rhodotorula diobovata]|uniref:Tetratricopeptide repeat protein 15 n=1 Tax=Rhodotorula diobovata TaxID=5288 RepID=A0A5C5G5K4_9BASI|nr:hypothetical protein DMC30DRAFT_443507 [Rhodotorula diobovata]
MQARSPSRSSPIAAVPRPRVESPSSQPPAQVSLSESLQQLQGQAAFAQPSPIPTRLSTAPPSAQSPPPPPLAPPTGLFVEGLTDRRLFVRLPESDPVQLLLEQYVPPEHRPRRDLSGDYRGQTLDQLVAAHNWRGVARLAYDQITQSPPQQTAHILDHWLLRFHALLRLHLVGALSAELSAVTSLLPPAPYLSPNPPSDLPFHPSVPFELYLLSASLPSIVPDIEGGDKPAAVEALARLLQAAKGEMWRAKRAGDGGTEGEWRERVERVGEVLSGVLSEIKADSAKRALLASSSPSPTDSLLAALARYHYSTGDLASLAASRPTADRDARKVRVLERVARAEWDEAEAELRGLVREDGEDLEAQVNLAVVLLYSAKLDEAITHLQSLLASHPLASHHSPALLFNLSTLYELRSERAQDDKVRLLVAAAACGGGAQGVEAGAFKLAL